MSHAELMQAKSLMRWYEERLRRLRVEIVEFEISAEYAREHYRMAAARCNDAAAYFDHEVAA